MQPILVPLDGSKVSEQVLPLVVTLASSLQCDLHLLHVVDTGRLPISVEPQGERHTPGIVQRQEQHAKVYLEGVARELAVFGRGVAYEVVLGDASMEINQRAEIHNAGLIAVSAHGRSGPGRWVLGNVADKVLRIAARPLLLYHPAEDAPADLPDVTAILLPLDGTPESATAVPVAIRLARALHRSVFVTRAAPVYSFAFGMEMPHTTPEVLEGIKGEAEDYLVATVERLRTKGVDAEKRLIMGEPAAGILRLAAEHKGGLMVMSTHGGSGLGRGVIGSVTDKVVRGGTMPVIVIPPGAARSFFAENTSREAARF